MEKIYLYLLPACSIHFLLTCFAMAAPTITSDQSALFALKAQVTTDPQQILSKNWSAAISVCEWIGVTCGPRHHRVTALNVSNMGLIGTIPLQLGNLSFLVYLDLSRNNFHGELPHDLGQLRRLEVLRFRNNSLQGRIPSSLSQCSKLQVLDLAFNKFTGFIPEEIGKLKMLQELYLGNNILNGTIPRELGNLTALKGLFLRNNSLSGSLPFEIFNILPLERIDFSSNNLSGFIPKEIGNSTMLILLDCGENYLTGSIPDGLFNLSRIRFLSLESNNLSGTLPSTMGYGLPSLEAIYLYENNLSGDLPNSISNCSELTLIEVSYNKFTGSIPNSLGDLRKLECLNVFRNNLMSDPSSPELSFIHSLPNCKDLMQLGLSGNPLDGILPDSIGNLSTSVERIYMDNCKISGRIPDAIGNLSSLLTLNMHRNQLNGSLPATVGNMQKLQGLGVADNKLSGVGLDILCGLQSLFIVDLRQNQISGSIPRCLGNVTSLRLLHIASNRLNATIPAQLWNLTDLLELNLSSNSLTGSLPDEVGRLKAATLIDLSMNQFSGGLPTSIGGLQKLKMLSLGHNRLEGFIPSQMDKMFSLELLDLSHNNLSGTIPKSLEILQDLKHFNVSFNSLSGEIPSQGPFRNFTSESFISNEALCGAQKFNVPECPTTSSHTTRTNNISIILFVLLGVGLAIGALVLGVVYLRCRKKVKGPNETKFFSVKTPEKISYHELLKATDEFSESNLIGTGGFGSVYKGTLCDGRIFAIKVFNLQYEGVFKSFDVECQVLRNLRHRNLTKVISSCSSPNFKALVLEFMPNGSLERWLYSHNYFLDMKQRLDIMIDVACALHYLHSGYSTPVVHCDLKPSNILLDHDMVAHISDFGISKLLAQEDNITYTETLATLGYAAPEYGLQGLVSTKSDVYSYGIMLMEVFTRTKPGDDMFGGNLNLKEWVKNSFPDSLVQVIDANLLKEGEEYFIEKLECLSSVMQVALNCSNESLTERCNMKDATVALEKIKIQLLPYITEDH